jgi:uncharacterized membrane protein
MIRWLFLRVRAEQVVSRRCGTSASGSESGSQSQVEALYQLEDPDADCDIDPDPDSFGIRNKWSACESRFGQNTFMSLNIVRLLKIYLVTVPVFFLIDLCWIGLVARNFYQKHLGYLMRPSVNWTAALLFYFLFIAGIVVFAVKPALEQQSAQRALAQGALFGFLAYATYDLTNLATIRDWPVIVTVVDMAWGAVLCGSVAWASYFIAWKIR